MSDDTVEFSNLKKEIRYYLTCIFCSYCRCECHSYTLSIVFFCAMSLIRIIRADSNVGT